MSASASTSISTKRTRSRSYSSTTEASIGRTRAHGAHPSAPKKPTNANVFVVSETSPRVSPTSIFSRGESPKKLSPAYRRLNASAPRWRTAFGSNGKTSAVFFFGPDDFATFSSAAAPGRMAESRSASTKGDARLSSATLTAARVFFAITANAVPIGFGFERSRDRSTGPCHRSAATPAAKPLPRATKAPGVVVDSVVSFFFFFNESESSAYDSQRVSETTSVRAGTTTPSLVSIANGCLDRSTFDTGSSRG